MSRTYHVIISPQALGDLERIYEHIALDSQQNAASFLQELLDSIDSLEQIPARHALIESRPRIKRETRAMPVGSYLIYYHVQEAQGRFGL